MVSELKAPKGKFRAVCVETSKGLGEDFFLGDFESQAEAKSIADKTADAFDPVYVYDDAGAMVYEAAPLAQTKEGQAEDEFKESDHPRVKSGSEAGQFTAGSGGVSTKTESGEKTETPQESKSSHPEGKSATSPHRKAKGESSGSEQAPQAKSSHLQTHASRETWPEHIKALKIPPAWTDVKVSSDPDANLLAIGKDSKGRAQYVYSERFAKTQAAIKFARIQSLEKDMPMIENQLADLRKSKDEKTAYLADCSTLIFKMGIRPGSDSDTQAKVKAYGATTLEGKHVIFEDGEVYLRFTGKKGVSINLRVEDSGLAKTLYARAQQAGEDGRVFDGVRDDTLREFVGDKLDHGGYHPKDMRTRLGTASAQQLVSEMPAPTSEKEYRKAVLKVAKQVSAKLGNTPTICLQSYIAPEVFSAWRQSYAA